MSHHVTFPMEETGEIISQGHTLKVKRHGWDCSCGEKGRGYPNERRALLGAQLHRAQSTLPS